MVSEGKAMTITAGNRATDKQCGPGAVAECSRLETPQGDRADWKWHGLLKPQSLFQQDHTSS